MMMPVNIEDENRTRYASMIYVLRLVISLLIRIRRNRELFVLIARINVRNHTIHTNYCGHSIRCQFTHTNTHTRIIHTHTRIPYSSSVYLKLRRIWIRIIGCVVVHTYFSWIIDVQLCCCHSECRSLSLQCSSMCLSLKHRLCPPFLYAIRDIWILRLRRLLFLEREENQNVYDVSQPIKINDQSSSLTIVFN